MYASFLVDCDLCFRRELEINNLKNKLDKEKERVRKYKEKINKLEAQ
jgi:hypothetical protein